MSVRGTWLRWLERGLLAAGIAIAIWCAVLIVRADMVARLPVPAPEPAAPGAVRQPPARGAWVARMVAPSVRLSATVLEGSDDATLARGAGHIEYTSLPGEPGNVGIAGHRDTTFMAVKRLRTGDPIELTTSGGIYRYVITRTFIVEPEDVHVLDETDRPTLTLVTCYPFTFIGNAPQRYIVQAELVAETMRAAAR